MAQKLYTKEMFLQAAEKCEVSMIDAKHIMKYIDEYVTPIELPSDEEIEEKAEFLFPTVNRMGGPTYIAHKSFIEGTKWMRDKIINQNK